jgi:nucleotide-binding universal stress UspA family protein
MSFKKIMVAVDESAFAAHAADVGTELAKSLNAELAFIHVIDPVDFAEPGSGVPADVMGSMAERDAKNLLSAFRERAPAKPAPLEFVELGKPSAKIVEGAKSWPADLIVVGSHGRGRVGSLVLGSVAEGVVHHAPCPVLIVRARV